YGAYSYFAYLRNRGWYVAATSVRTNVTGPAVQEILRQISGMTEKPVTDDELQLARESLIGNIVGDLETNANTANLMERLYLYDLPLDYYSAFVKNIAGVTGGSVQEISKKYLLPNSIIIVAVGDRKRIEADLRKLGMTIEYRDLNGTPIERKSAG